MKGCLLNIAAAFSLAAFLASGVFWARSYQFDHSQTGESISFTRSDPLWWVISHRGGVTLCRQYGKEWGKEFGNAQLLGFRLGGLKGPRGSLINLRFPYWFLSTATAVLPLAWGVRALRARRGRREGLCRRCGYDLRASAGRCPECGSAITAVGAVA